jgi:DNA-binding NarL/FixJ family response regulator
LDRPAIVLVDAQPVTRTSLRRLLEAEGFDVRAEAGDAETAIEACLRERPELCLVDLDLPGGGIRVVHEVCRRVPDASVVVLTASEAPKDLIDAIRAGASGYLVKSMEPSRIPYALRAGLAGEAAIPRVMVMDLVRDMQAPGRHRVIADKIGRVELTHRELEVLRLLCEDLSSAEIAERLMVSPVTVRRHAAQVVRKLGARNREDAIRLMRGRA